MRLLLISAALLFTACSPAPSDQATAPTAAAEAPEAGANPDTAALGATLQTGSWTLRADEGTTAAGFGAPESEYQFVIACEAGSNITLTAEHELSPDQDTTLRIITAVQTLNLPARSFNEGLPTVTAHVTQDAATKTPLISMLGAPTDRFAVDIAGQITVFPWHDSIAQALTACR
jgi:hypothetical protein